MPSNPTAFVDTTILTDATIKSGRERAEALASLKKYQRTELPVYAIKEFKHGPIDYGKYAFNKLRETGNVGGLMHTLSSHTRMTNRHRTALRLVADAYKHVQATRSSSLSTAYPTLGDADSSFEASIRLHLKMTVKKGWKAAFSLTDAVVFPLACYAMEPPIELKNGEMSARPRECKVNVCSLNTELRGKYKFDVTKLHAAIDSLPKTLKKKPENVKRLKALRVLQVGSPPFAPKSCLAFGDAYFAIYCPNGAEILTTNLVDHVPLAAALKKTAVSPKDVLP